MKPRFQIIHVVPEERLQPVYIIPVTKGQSKDILTLTFVLDSP